MEKAHSEQRGAAGLTTEDGGKEMIDAPMIKQVRIAKFSMPARCRLYLHLHCVRRKTPFAPRWLQDSQYRPSQTATCEHARSS